MAITMSEFLIGVEFGLRLTKRLYYGKGAPAAEVMTKAAEDHLPMAVMAYAEVDEPGAVDNPDFPSYQPYVHGRCDPPALIPLEMHEVSMEIDCYMDTAFVSVSGSWRLHCLMASKSFDCRIVVPMGEKGSLLGVEVDISKTGRSYHSKWVTIEETDDDVGKVSRYEGQYLKPDMYTFKVPQVDGGSKLSVKLSWSQNLSYDKGRFCLGIPFSFPTYVNPVVKAMPTVQKIQLNMNSATGRELSCKCTSHPLKVLTRELRNQKFVYREEVATWSRTDFDFSYTVSSTDVIGGVLLQAASFHDLDERDMFCLYLYPGNNQQRKVFRKEVVFVIDISGSMQGHPLENVKNGLLEMLSKMNPEDRFNIIAFNNDMHLFSSTMELASQVSILNATQWLNNSLNADGGTNILLPLKKAMTLLADTIDSVPLVFLLTDGSVENEREICSVVKGYLTSRGPISPRIFTFGIGLYCNLYFLQTLSDIGRGHSDCAYNTDSISNRMNKLFTRASSVFIANITPKLSEHLDSVELFPSHIPDLSWTGPLIVPGRYKGKFPDNLKVCGTLADMSSFVADLKVHNAKDLPLDRILARRHIDALTAHAWLSERKELEEKVAKISIQTSFPSEYTNLLLLQSDCGTKSGNLVLVQELSNSMKQIISKMNLPRIGNVQAQKDILLGQLGVGFGNLLATQKNKPPGWEEPKSPEGTEVLVNAASNCWRQLLDRCCCICFLNTCSVMNGQVSVVFTQLCAALACFECLNCCYELCAGG